MASEKAVSRLFHVKFCLVYFCITFMERNWCQLRFSLPSFSKCYHGHNRRCGEIIDQKNEIDKQWVNERLPNTVRPSSGKSDSYCSITVNLFKSGASIYIKLEPGYVCFETLSMREMATLNLSQSALLSDSIVKIIFIKYVW